MNRRNQENKIELLKILSKGCKKHLVYRAIRKATEQCAECVFVWKAELNLIN